MEHPDPNRLATVPLFQGLSDEQRHMLAAWLEVEVFTPGRPPARKDQSGYAFFILDSGQAHAELDGEVLETLQPGAVFGEMAFFSPSGRRSATIVPDSEIRVFSMFGTYFRQMQSELPEVAARLERLVEERSARVQATKPQQ
jgi:CRP/FNR family cyclic AMP-dependent transcriptional regulator